MKIFFRILIILTITFNVFSCGYTPLYVGMKNIDIQIILLENKGDKEIKNNLERYLSPNLENTKDNKVRIKINSNYTKSVLAKDAAGVATSYNLQAKSSIIIDFKGSVQTLNIIESFEMDKLDNAFDEQNFELDVKQNFSNMVYQRLMLKLSQIK